MILVIETASTACSVALIEGARVIAHVHEDVARGHAELLVPMIAELPEGGRADGILVNCGPGSFTGVRVGLAAAKALGLAWGIPVHGYSTHALLAATLFDAYRDLTEAVIAMEGGHGEVFVQTFAAHPLQALDVLESLPPAHVTPCSVAAGSAAGNAGHPRFAITDRKNRGNYCRLCTFQNYNGRIRIADDCNAS